MKVYRNSQEVVVLAFTRGESRVPFTAALSDFFFRKQIWCNVNRCLRLHQKNLNRTVIFLFAYDTLKVGVPMETAAIVRTFHVAASVHEQRWQWWRIMRVFKLMPHFRPCMDGGAAFLWADGRHEDICRAGFRHVVALCIEVNCSCVFKQAR